MTLCRDKGQRGRWPAWQALDPPVMSLSAQGGKSSMSSTEPVHTEGETHPWKVNVPDHPLRADSPEYVAARKQMIEIAAQAPGLIYGEAPYQDHHGGALWMKDAQGWFLVRNLAGIEWSAQFCADPAKVDLLRQNAKRLYDLLAPQIKQQLDPGELLDTPIQDAAGVAKWTDSIFNAGVPLHPGFHTGVLPAGGAQNPAAAADPQPGGVHHYPTPVADIQLFSTTISSSGSPMNRGTPPRSRSWPSAAAETQASMCSTPRRGHNWHSKSRRLNARAPR